MKRLALLLAVLPVLALAGDYHLRRDTLPPMPGGTTNVVKYVIPGGTGGEVIEVQTWGSANADTATVQRVSACKCVTNTLATAEASMAASCTAVTSLNSLTSGGLMQDYVLVTGTGTNVFNVALVVKQHE